MEGDLRFFSHHDVMRMIERAAARADLALRYTQGFNPRPVFSLVCPRPVGVAALDDLLVITLAAPMEAGELLRRLNDAAPVGMTFVKAVARQARRAPQVEAAEYRLDLDDGQARGVSRRLSDLDGRDEWPVERRTAGKRCGVEAVRSNVDLRPLVSQLALDGRVLRFRLVRRSERWARPGEVLGLLGLDERADLARCVRTSVKYEMDPGGALVAPGEQT